jgi:outer membrane protein OmpA-like peptidoglycan-associated protein
VARPETAGSIQEIDAKYDLLQRGQYATISADIQAVKMDPGVPLGLYEARNAVKIAKAAGADHYAADSFLKAEQLLRQAENYHAHHAEKKQVEMTAREAVQTAEDARTITVKRREDERLAQERQAAADREARSKAEAAEAAKRSAQAEAVAAQAERARLEAELAAERAGRERAEVEAARAALLAQQQNLQVEADRARQSADLQSRQRLEAEAGRDSALAQQRQAQAEAEKAHRDVEQAERLRQQAETEKAELRSRLLNQLSLILQTRDSVRGLIVNMSDVLFDSGSFTLKPAAREKLAKISGIVVAYPGLNLQIEGHTDAVGRDEFNQLLSEQRANSVRDFLMQQGVPAPSITARGLGKTQPVSTNDTPEGRQQNRRVELVVTGEAIGTATLASAKTSTQ